MKSSADLLGKSGAATLPDWAVACTVEAGFAADSGGRMFKSERLSGPSNVGGGCGQWS